MSINDELLELNTQIACLETKKVRLMGRLMMAELRGEDISRVGQETSPLGPRRHIAAVKRRIAGEQAAGEIPGHRGATIVGRRHMLTQEALAQELGRNTRDPERMLAKTAPPLSPVNDTNGADDGLEDRLLNQWRSAR